MVIAFGAIGLGLLPSVFLEPAPVPATSTALDVALKPEAPVVFAIFVAYVAVLVLLFATDLDQRILPDIVTLPMIPLALLFALSGQSPSSATSSCRPSLPPYSSRRCSICPRSCSGPVHSGLAT